MSGFNHSASNIPCEDALLDFEKEVDVLNDVSIEIFFQLLDVANKLADAIAVERLVGRGRAHARALPPTAPFSDQQRHAAHIRLDREHQGHTRQMHRHIHHCGLASIDAKCHLSGRIYRTTASSCYPSSRIL